MQRIIVIVHSFQSEFFGKRREKRKKKVSINAETVAWLIDCRKISNRKTEKFISASFVIKSKAIKKKWNILFSFLFSCPVIFTEYNFAHSFLFSFFFLYFVCFDSGQTLMWYYDVKKVHWHQVIGRNTCIHSNNNNKIYKPYMYKQYNQWYANTNIIISSYSRAPLSSFKITLCTKRFGYIHLLGDFTKTKIAFSFFYIFF